MKKLYFIICTLCIFNCALLQAQIECSTIAEVKSLANGTECLYTGIATTTYYDAFNGIIMQDATGAILVNHYSLTASNSTTVKVSMEITNVQGVFKVEDASYMTRIELTKSSQVKAIEVKSEKASFTVKTIDFDEYMSNVAGYSGVPVRFEDVNIRPITGTSNYEIYSLSTDNKLTVNFQNALGVVVPTKADLEGFLSADYSGKIFRVGSVDVITPYAYKTINNIKNAVTEVVDKEYELTDTFTVTNVIKTESENIVYIQDSELAKNPANYAVRVLLPTSVDVKVGNRITGLYGKLTPYTKGDIQKSATFTQNSTTQVKVISATGKATVLGKYIYELKDNDMQNASKYDAGLICFSNGVVTKNPDGTYSYVVENENGQGKKSVSLKMAGVEDLSSYVGKSCPVQGVLDIAATYPENTMTLIMRSDKDFLEPVIQFETIADIINAGVPVASGIEYQLIQSALVTYKFTKAQGTSVYFAIVQDNTAAIVLSFGESDLTDISVGDTITGISGVYDARARTNVLNVSAEQSKSIKVKNSGNPIVGIEVTIKDIIDNKAHYENQVVTVKKIINEYIEDGELKLGYFVQGNNKLQYTTGANSGDFTYYKYMDITGIVDNYLIGEYFSIWPLSQDYIIDLGEVPVFIEDAEDNVNIYSGFETIFIDTQAGEHIKVFNLQGQLLFADVATDNLTIIKNIKDRFVVVLVDNKPYKMLVK